LLYDSNGGGYVRNFTSVVPFACLISAFGLWQVISWILKRVKFQSSVKALILISVIIFISAGQFKFSAINTYALSKPWNSQCILKTMDSKLGSELFWKMLISSREKYQDYDTEYQALPELFLSPCLGN